VARGNGWSFPVLRCCIGYDVGHGRETHCGVDGLARAGSGMGPSSVRPYDAAHVRIVVKYPPTEGVTMSTTRAQLALNVDDVAAETAFYERMFGGSAAQGARRLRQLRESLPGGAS